MQFKLHTSNTAEQIVDINLTLNQAAERAGAASVLAYIDNTVHVAEGQAAPSSQIAAQLGLDRGVSFRDAMDATHYCGPQGAQAASTEDGSVTGRLVTQAVLLRTIENALRPDNSGYAAMLNRYAALRQSVAGTRIEQPLLDFKRPAEGRPMPIAQLSEPTRMALLTTSQRQVAILGESIGIEYSDQVAQNISLDIVSLSLQRQAEESAAERAMFFFRTFLNGDVDVNMVPLANVAGAVNEADQLDPSATTGLTQRAWVKWLFKDHLKRRIDTIITDLDGAMAIEARLGRPNVQGDNATSKRIDTLEIVVNPEWPDKVNVVITNDPTWPANTAVGFDSRYGYALVNSSILDYRAAEQLAIRRSTKMRFDSGQIAYRYMNDAWSVLTWN